MRRASAWAEAVFHVLAHVDVPFAASCFNPLYIAWIAARVGPASERMLAEDARVLATASHEVLARAQALAWAFDVAPPAERTLAEMDANDALAIALSAGPIAEVLRAAAELELAWLPAIDPPSLDLARVLPAAPALTRHSVTPVAALGLRGRVHGDRIFVGAPGIAGADAEHVAWQAAHEATVSEVAGADHVETERRALGLLRSRARRAGLGAEHGRWLAHLDLGAIGAIPDVDDGAE